MFDLTVLDSLSGERRDAAGGKRSATAAAQAFPRVVTTGRKNGKVKPCHVEEETGERIQLVAASQDRLTVIRHLVPEESSSSGVALIDALTFSLVPPEENSYVWVVKEMGQFIDIGTFEQRRGLFGFRYSARFGDGAGVMAWGGDSQRGRVYFSLMGQGCSMVKNWPALAMWLETHRATIKRADLAHDDFEGKMVSIAWAVNQYAGEGFNAGGRKPKHELRGDWLAGETSTEGRTLGVGSRASGKYARIYEKGKQLGESTSAWTRVEVEWLAKSRYIPFDIVTRPGQYLAGAYPCLGFLSAEQSVIKTISKGGRIAYDTAVENAKRHCGKTVNLMLDVLGGDYGEVVNSLIRPGYPSRIDPYSYHVKQNPAMLDPQQQGDV